MTPIETLIQRLELLCEKMEPIPEFPKALPLLIAEIRRLNKAISDKEKETREADCKAVCVACREPRGAEFPNGYGPAVFHFEKHWEHEIGQGQYTNCDAAAIRALPLTNPGDGCGHVMKCGHGSFSVDGGGVKITCNDCGKDLTDEG